MARGKPTRTKEQSAMQRQRTAHNQIKRYSKLLEEYPHDLHRGAWEAKKEKYEKALHT